MLAVTGRKYGGKSLEIKALISGSRCAVLSRQIMKRTVVERRPEEILL